MPLPTSPLPLTRLAFACLMLVQPSFAQEEIEKDASPSEATEEPPAIVTPSVPEAAGDTLAAPPELEWSVIGELPPAPGFDKQPGLAGTYAGAHQNVLLIAGGANYAVGQPWTDAPKAYWKNIYVLEQAKDAQDKEVFQWIPCETELPQEMAYGASVSTQDGVICIGGQDVGKTYATCFCLSWDATDRKVTVEKFPSLPKPLTHLGASLIGETIYVAGGSESVGGKGTTSFFSLDLRKKGTAKTFVWKTLKPWDGAPRLGAMVSSGTDGEKESLYICGGRNPGAPEDFVSDLHRYDPDTKEWSILGNALDSSGLTATLVDAPGFFVPPHHFVMVGGTDKAFTQYLEANALRLNSPDKEETGARTKVQQMLLENFPGYSRNVMAFDVRASEWVRIGTFPGRPPVATPVIYWEGSVILPGGETGPGTRTNKIYKATVIKKARAVE